MSSKSDDIGYGCFWAVLIIMFISGMLFEIFKVFVVFKYLFS
jgi:hypothetical protein